MKSNVLDPDEGVGYLGVCTCQSHGTVHLRLVCFITSNFVSKKEMEKEIENDRE